jgi:hypothetical protein
MPSGKCLDVLLLDKIKNQRSESFLIRLIDLFLKDAPMRIDEAWKAGKAKDYRKVVVASHILRCLAENIGAINIRDLAAAAEVSADGEHEASAFLGNILFDLEIAFAEVRICLLEAKQGMSA